jgi:hypothetical protein
MAQRSRRTALADSVVGVLDGLRLVEHDVIELHVFQSGGVAAQRAVGVRTRSAAEKSVALRVRPV